MMRRRVIMKKSKRSGFLALCLSGIVLFLAASGCTVQKGGLQIASSGAASGTASGASSRSEGKKSGDFVYVVKEDGKAKITFYSGDINVTAIDIPKTVDGYIVDELADYLLEDRKKATKITIPSTVMTFGQHVFVSCESLTEAVIPEGTTVISTGLFKYCKSLETVTLPSTVKEIQEYAFAGCSSLKTINIPDDVTFPDNAFTGCTSLVNDRVKLSDTITYGVTGTFPDCENWTKDIELKESSSKPGIYVATVKNLPQDTYQFKVRANGEWTDSWGELDRGATYNSQINCEVTLNRTSNVEITFDTTNEDSQLWVVSYQVK